MNSPAWKAAQTAIVLTLAFTSVTLFVRSQTGAKLLGPVEWFASPRAPTDPLPGQYGVPTQSSARTAVGSPTDDDDDDDLPPEIRLRTLRSGLKKDEELAKAIRDAMLAGPSAKKADKSRSEMPSALIGVVERTRDRIETLRDISRVIGSRAAQSRSTPSMRFAESMPAEDPPPLKPVGTPLPLASPGRAPVQLDIEQRSYLDWNLIVSILSGIVTFVVAIFGDNLIKRWQRPIAPNGATSSAGGAEGAKPNAP